MIKKSTCNEEDLSSIPGLGRSPGGPLQGSGLENSMDYTVHGVAKSQTQLSNFHFHRDYSLAVETKGCIDSGLGQPLGLRFTDGNRKRKLFC